MESKKVFTRDEAMRHANISDKGRYYYALRALGIVHNAQGKITADEVNKVQAYRTHGRFAKRGRKFGTLQKR